MHATSGISVDIFWEFPNVVVSNQTLVGCNFYAEALFCALFYGLCSLALVCVSLRPPAFRMTALGNVRKMESPIAGIQRTQATLASHSAVPRGMNVARISANRAIRVAHNERRVCGTVFKFGRDRTAKER